LEAFATLRDPHFQASELALWKDALPKSQTRVADSTELDRLEKQMASQQGQQEGTHFASDKVDRYTIKTPTV
jgi:hypothetical protein